jgi:peptidyl serine alpha-galactosyltransferase
MHVVFSAECNHLFDWHSVALFHSFARVQQHGNVTRLLACAPHELAKYPKTALEMGPTFVHRNMRDDPLVDEKGYPSYNKPYSVMVWLAANSISEDYILMMDAGCPEG